MISIKRQIAIKREVDIGNEVIEVEFQVQITKDNPSYDDIYGTIKGNNYYFAENIDWDTSAYKSEENFIIDGYLDRNFYSIEQEAIKKYLDEFAE